MKIIAVLCFAAAASAFAPGSSVARNDCSSLALERSTDENQGAKRKKRVAMKTVRRVAGAFGTIALATSAVPAVAHAKKAQKTASAISPEMLKSIATIAAGSMCAVFTRFLQVAQAKKSQVAVEQATKVRGVSPELFRSIWTFCAGCAAAIIGGKLFGEAPLTACTSTINQVFPGAMKYKDVVSKVSKVLARKHGYSRKNSLLATSFCADEVNRALEDELRRAFGENFSMGGLAGFPFGGVTSFGAMASHIPDGGSCLIVFGPHVGVDSAGNVGTVERRGRAEGGPCCGAAISAAAYVASVAKDARCTKKAVPTAPLDAQQGFVGSMLLPYSKRLENAYRVNAELPYILYEAQKTMIGNMVGAAAGTVASPGKIAILGGIQINTPESTSSYFKPMSFEVFDNKAIFAEDLLPSIL